MHEHDKFNNFFPANLSLVTIEKADEIKYNRLTLKWTVHDREQISPSL